MEVYKEGIIEKQSSTEENDQFNLAYFLKKAFLGQIARRYFIIGSVAWLQPSCFIEKSRVIEYENVRTILKDYEVSK